jgi:glycerol-3-phosphate acyltransferase PlsY
MRYEFPVLLDFPQWLAVLIAIAIAYLLGSTPVAYITSKWRGVNIYSVDSGNPGTANVFRNVGHWWGSWVFSADVTKGIAAIIAPGLLGVHGNLILLAGAAVVIGQQYPVFQRFQGGGGLATASGVLMALHPTIGLISLALTLGLLLPILRSGGSAAGVGLMAYMLIALAAEAPKSVILASLLLGGLVLIRALTRTRRTGNLSGPNSDTLTELTHPPMDLPAPDIDQLGPETMRPA